MKLTIKILFFLLLINSCKEDNTKTKTETPTQEKKEVVTEN